MKSDLVSRLLERAYTLEAMGRENKAIDTEHSLATITLTRDMLREAADALEAKDAEIVRLESKVAILEADVGLLCLSLAHAHERAMFICREVGRYGYGPVQKIAQEHADHLRQALQDTDNG